MLESEFKTNRADLLRFQLVASAATLSLLYHHEVKYLAQTLTTLSADLDAAIKHLKGPIKLRCQEVLESVSTAKETLVHWATSRRTWAFWIARGWPVSSTWRARLIER